MIANKFMIGKNSNLDIKIGHIVGYNIKKCYVPDYGNDTGYKLTYGFFIHIKLDNNDQYDMVVDAFGSGRYLSEIVPSRGTGENIKVTRCIRWKNIKDLNKQAKRRAKISKGLKKCGLYQTTFEYNPSILDVMKICNADELVDLIGKEVKVSAIIDNPVYNVYNYNMLLSFSLFDMSTNKVIIPVLVNINTNNESINKYIESIMIMHPGMNIPEYHKSEELK